MQIKTTSQELRMGKIKRQVWRGCGEIRKLTPVVDTLKGAAALENDLAVPQQVKDRFAT